jgi:hypothetical protein
MDYALLNWFPEHLIADFLPPSFTLDQAGVEFLLEQYLLISGDSIKDSLKPVNHALRISRPPGHSICLIIG